LIPLKSFYFLGRDYNFTDPNAKVFYFGDYQRANSQNCFKKQTYDTIKVMAEFVKEPFAWLLGQSYKYLLNGNKHFDELLNEAIKGLKIDFNFPIVGYLKFLNSLNNATSIIHNRVIKEI